MKKTIYDRGDLLGDFEIQEFLGSSVFSKTYKAYNHLRDRTSLLKLFEPSDFKIIGREQFRSELNVLEALDHPHIVKLFTYGYLTDGTFFIELEFIEGPTVFNLLREAKKSETLPCLPLREIRKAALEILDALIYLREKTPQRIIHLEINPSSLILNPIRGLVIIDLNLNIELEVGQSPRTYEGAYDDYMPPYSVGVVLYEMVTGQLPLDLTGDDKTTLDIKEIFPGLDAAAAEIILKAIAPNPEHRYQNAWAMKEDILLRWLLPTPSEEVISNLLNKIETAINEIEQIEVDLRLNRAYELVEVGHWLEEAQVNATTQDLVQLEQLNKRYSYLAEPVANLLQEHAYNLLKRYQDGLASVDLEQWEKSLNEVQIDLGLVANLSPERTIQAEFQAWQDQLTRQRNKVTSKIRLQELRHDINQLWQRGDMVEEANPDRAIDYCKQALNRVEAETGTSWETEEVDELLLLKHEARERFDNLRIRHEVPVTKTTSEDLVKVVIQFKEWTEKDPKKTVTYYEGVYSQTSKSMPVQEASEIAIDKLVHLWSEKIQEYITEAKKELDAHKPREAKAALQRWKLLPGLYDNQLGQIIVNNDLLMIQSVEELIELELSALEKAEVFAAKAKAETDPIKASQHWQAARDAYLYLPDLDTLRNEIINQAREEITRRLDDTEAGLRQEQWSFCSLWLNRAKSLLLLDQGLITEFLTRYESLQRVYDDIEPLTQHVSKQLGEKEAIEILRHLRIKYEESYWPSWSKLQAQVAELEVRNNIETIEQQAGKVCQPRGILVELESLYRDTEDILINPPHGLSLSGRQRLEKLAVKLRAWIGFMRARDELLKMDKYESSEVENEFLDLPDLQLIKQGIEAAKLDPEAVAALRQQGLEEKFDRNRPVDFRALSERGRGRGEKKEQKR